MRFFASLRMTNIWMMLLFVCPGTFAADPSKAAFPIQNKGNPFPLDFNKFGNMAGRGTNEYKFKITDRYALAKAMGAGLYPTGSSLLESDPSFRSWKKKNSGPYSHWDHVQSGDPQSDFYVWALARDVGPGTKLLFTGHALAEAGHYLHALKAYYAVLVLFPKEPCWSADHSFVWYVANDAIGRIESITQEHPEIGFRLQGSRFKVTNGDDTDLKNDVFVIDPGQWVKNGEMKEVDVSTLQIIDQRGLGRVRLVQFENKHWQLSVDGKPTVVRGVTYNPVPVGQHISEYGSSWMSEDANDNGEPDNPYESWVDENRNSRQDPDESAIGDFELMKKMGVNAIRLYHNPAGGVRYDPSSINKETLRAMVNRFGVGVIMGDFLGAYTQGSGASWDEGTDYTDPVQLENMRLSVKNLVMDHRSEPYVLMWLLGNENLMPADYSGVNATRTRAAQQVKEYLQFVNEIADMIHKLDPDHPVAVGNLDLVSLEEYARYAPNVDIFGVNSYRGRSGFGIVWKNVREILDRPVLITEFGCDAYNSKANAEDEESQARYHEGNWNDIERHLAGSPSEGNAIGGVVFEWLDEWWKSHTGSYVDHSTATDNHMPFPDGAANEEWYGLISRGDGSDSLLRQPRKAYYLYKDKLWK